MTHHILTSAHLLDLAENLQRAGFVVETRQVLSAQQLDNLLLSLTASKDEISTEDLKHFLAPIFCTNKEEQATFYARFEEWLKTQPGLQDQFESEAPDEPQVQPIRRKRWRRWIWVGAAVLGIVALTWFSQTNRTYDVSIQINHRITGEPVEGAQVVYFEGFNEKGADTVYTDSEGSATFYGATTGTVYLSEDKVGFVSFFEAKADGFLVDREPTYLLDNQQFVQQLKFSLTPDLGPQLLSGNVLNADDGTPVQGALVISFADSAYTDPLGRFTLTYNPSVGLQSIYTEHENFSSFDTQLTLDGFTTHDSLEIFLTPTLTTSPLEDSLFALVDRINTYAAEQQDLVNQMPSWQKFIRDQKQLLQRASIGLPALLLLLWLGVTARRRRMILQKQSSTSVPETSTIRVRGLTDYLFRGKRMRRTVQQFYQREEIYSHRLNPDATVHASIRKAGLFTPIYASRYRPPEYLILIDRFDFNDQYARLIEGLVGRLASDGIYTDQYYFDGDPRYCRPIKNPLTQIHISELQRLHSNHRLLVFTTGEQFIDTNTGRPYAWLDVFNQWTHRGLFIPDRTENAAFFAQQLESTGFVVNPASTAGMAIHIAHLLNPNVRPSIDWDRIRRYALYFDEHMDRWLHRQEPEPAAVDRLMFELQLFLEEDSFEWLCACAIYPELHWELTLYLATKLALGERAVPEDKEYESIQNKLIDLTRLPWFRESLMPDWLRLKLIATMSKEQYTKVRTILRDLLGSAKEQDVAPDSISLNYAQRSLKEIVLNRLRTDDRPRVLKDYVFAGFMTSGSPNRLNLPVPKALKRLLYRKGNAMLGLRPAAASFMAGICGLGLWTSVELAQPQDIFYDVIPSFSVQADSSQNVVPFVAESNESADYYMFEFAKSLELEMGNFASSSVFLSYQDFLVSRLNSTVQLDTSIFQIQPTLDQYLASDSTLTLPKLPWSIVPEPELLAEENPASLTTVSFNAVSSSIIRGESTTLNWSVTNADQVRIVPDIGAVEATGSVVIAPTSTTTYRLIATGAGGEIEQTTTIRVFDQPQVPIPVVSFLADNTEIEQGDSTILSWSVTNATQVSIVPNIGTVDTIGSVIIIPDTTTTYRLVATGKGGDAEEAITIPVVDLRPQNPIPDVSFLADKTAIELGDSTTLYWSTSNADSVHIDQGIGQVNAQGSLTVSPKNSTAYSLTATNEREGAYRTNRIEITVLGSFSQITPPDVGARFTNNIGMEFVRIRAGSFQMGSEDGEDNQKPVHTVRITKDFYMGVTEVTQGQWQRVMGDNPSEFKRGENNPVETVNWNQVQEFIQQLDSVDQQYNYRLPTEAEWEFACRAGSTTEYFYGDNASLLDLYVVYGKGFQGGHEPVKSKQPNAWGLYDMIGNVFEWTSDWYGENYYEISPSSDPAGPEQGDSGVSRGGSYLNTDRGLLRCSYRAYPERFNADGLRGFRLVALPISG